VPPTLYLLSQVVINKLETKAEYVHYPPLLIHAYPWWLSEHLFIFVFDLVVVL
jgi:hypothetical protein